MNYLMSLIDELKYVLCSVYLVMLNLVFDKVQDLCYGENLYQSVVFYCDFVVLVGVLVNYCQLQGKELLYNNIVDLDVVWECVKMFDVLVCVIIKYVNLCGVVVGNDLVDVYVKVFQIDLILVFGGIIVFNCEVDEVVV